MKLKLLDTVELLHDIPNEGLTKGDIGAIVHEYSESDEPYLVEFVDERGATTALITVTPSQIKAHSSIK